MLTHRTNAWAKAGFPQFGEAKIALHGIRIFPTDSTSPVAYNFGFVFTNDRIKLCKGMWYISGYHTLYMCSKILFKFGRCIRKVAERLDGTRI